ncbi:hypothetical protein ONR75_13510 [Rhodopseudomonas sp. P2A-2r]|uniref:hypothetical protein n=1 Tax=Rhodopseudomonas sp. P2A-2r TaxID=2991972 RepID=UPI002234C99D|nr:hypothetical protein [Rhodopseudomonas sp. P2A-2r]UZE51523.1 hypothetical protein ONR75_13510 [Rhodopseudomonas sp. P2A-2r]
MTGFHSCSARAFAMAVIVAAASQPALAQQQPAPPPAALQAAPAPPAKPFPQSAEWSNLPKMILERQFAGPLQDTVIQRLRDPVDGTVCYLYLPISAPHSPTTATGFVQYGPNVIGSINCSPAAARAVAPATARKP